MNLELQIILALLLDSVIGDPRWLPHPVRLIGWFAMKSENISRTLIIHARLAGIVTVLIILGMTGSVGWGLIVLAGKIHPYLGEIVSIVLLYTCFATRDLIGHSNDVHQALNNDDLPEARRKVGMIVGRDTADLDKSGVIKACVESVAENTVDGVTAPLFWAVIAGPVGALLYKAVNTLDSTFGYKNERYLNFGWASARLDDYINWLPARLTGLVMIPAALLCRLSAGDAWKIFLRDRDKHISPNAGQSEAVMAGALGIRLGGTSNYFGEKVSKATMGDPLREPESGHIAKANFLLGISTILMAGLLIGIRLICLS